MKKLRVLIADDEAPARNKMIRMLQSIEECEIVNVSSNGQDALENILILKPDIAFLDIEMPGINGLEVVQQIPNDMDIAVVFATAYHDYAIKAFELNAIDYLLKPFGEARIKQAVAKAEKNIVKVKDALSHTQEINTKFSITVGDRIKLIDFSEIVCIEVEDRATHIYTLDNKFMTIEPLESVHKKLPEADFIKVNRAAVINRKLIKEIVLWFSNRYKIIMTNNREVVSSRERSKSIKDILKI